METSKKYQCVSCEKYFNKLNSDNQCPYCFSGNWVKGCIDEQPITKDQKIDALVSNLVDVCCNDTGFLVSVIRNGFKGYEEMTDAEINAEYADYIQNEGIANENA